MNQYFSKNLQSGLICTLKCDGGEPHCTVVMTSVDGGVRFSVVGTGILTGYHAFHVHQGGDLSEGCKSLGAHYNPTGVNHGALNELTSHSGDLGNLYFDESGKCSTEFISLRLSLYELVGRSLVIHSGIDDLGRGGNPESLKTGNSGSRVCCGVIGFKQS